MAPRKRPTLEQKRAVVLEKGERKAVTLVQQLNALRNAKDLKRKAQQTRKREVRPCLATPAPAMETSAQFQGDHAVREQELGIEVSGLAIKHTWCDVRPRG